MQYDKLIIDHEVYMFNDITGRVEEVRFRFIFFKFIKKIEHRIFLNVAQKLFQKIPELTRLTQNRLQEVQKWHGKFEQLTRILKK